MVSEDGTHKAVNDIRYVSLSDLHLGAENSILTRLTSVSNGTVKLKADPTTASDVMIRLVDCLRLLISQNHGRQKPTLILNGDVLELAFLNKVANREVKQTDTVLSEWREDI